MSVRPVELNGMLQRSMDVGQIKQQEDQKPLVNQQNVQMQAMAQEVRQHSQVNSAEKSAREYDFKDKENGNGYAKKKQKKKQSSSEKKEHTDDRVIVKGPTTGSFDIKI